MGIGDNNWRAQKRTSSFGGNMGGHKGPAKADSWLEGGFRTAAQ